MYHTMIFVGRLGKDPEMKYTPEGKPVTTFSVAVDDGFGEKKKTMWVRVSAWEKLAETCNSYLKKGGKVLVEGRLNCDQATGGPRIWESNGKPGAAFEVTAATVRFLSERQTEQQPSEEETDYF